MKKILFLLISLSCILLQAQETVTLYIQNGSDDAYQLFRDPSWENPTGEMFVEAENLFVGYTYPPAMYYMIGLRYQSVPIPSGATIESAYVQFYSFEANNDTTGIRVRGELNPNPLPFASVDYNISDRETGHSELWVASEWQAFIPGPNQRTHDIRGIVQELIDMEGWVKNNPMVLFFKGTTPGFGEDYPKAACSWEYMGEMYAPVLTITYLNPAGIHENNNSSTLRVFPNPIRDEFTLSFVGLKKGEYSIRIFNLEGQKVYAAALTHQRQEDLQIELSATRMNLQPGVYMLSVSGSQTNAIRKIVVQ